MWCYKSNYNDNVEQCIEYKPNFLTWTTILFNRYITDEMTAFH